MERKTYLSKKVYLLICLLCIGSLILISGIYIERAQTLLYEESQKMIDEIAKQAAEGISDRLVEEFEYLQTIVDIVIEDINISDADKIQKLEQIKGVKGIRDIGIADRDGNLDLVNGGKCKVGYRRYFKEAIKGNPYISEVMISLIDGELIVVYALPITKKNEITHVLVAIYTAEELFEKVSQGFFEGEGDLYMLNQEGYIKYSSSGIRGEAVQEHKKWHERIGTPKEEDILIKFCEEYLKQEEERYYTLAPIKNAPQWNLLYSVPKEVVSYNTSFIIRGMYHIALWIGGLFTLVIIYILVTGEITKRRIYQLAYLSDETGIYNRNKFIAEAKKKLKKGKEAYSVIYFDIDNFRIYNEIFSESFGTILLQKISQKLREKFVSYDVLYAHLGRDHFTLLVPMQHQDYILRLIKFLEDNLAEIQVEQYPHIHIVLSIGIYHIPKDSQDIEGAINKASLARQRIKGHHEIRHSFYDERQSERIKADRQLESDIIKALEKKQFSVYYQPKFEVATQKIIGAEALIRWNHPEEGMISPCRFIPLAEANGSILFITKYVIKEVCKDLRAWKKQGIQTVPLSINFSQVELYTPDILDYIKQCLKDYEVEPKWLEIEMTERIALEDLQTARRMIMAFKELGMKVSMDDFGSGYSGPTYLKVLPFDVIKIDKGLIDDIENDLRSKQLLLGVVNIVKAMGLSIVAEGVENTSQLRCVEKMGIDYIQGYVFEKPLERQKFEKKLIKN